jgi:hypothetical protein
MCGVGVVVLPLGVAHADEASERPKGPTVGVGVGSSLEPLYTQMDVVTVPIDRAGLRLRLGDRWTLAPELVYRSDVIVSVSGETDYERQALGVATGVRWVANSRGPMDLVVLASAEAGRGTQTFTERPFKPENLAFFTVEVGGGLGIEAFLRPQWSVGLDAQMTLYAHEGVKRPSGPTRDTTLRLGWAPGMTASTYLYF